MSSLKITRFLGITPKISPELLPDTGAQIARNCKLYSGDLIPFPKPGLVANAGKTGTLRTLYALRNPDTDALVWMTWANVVDIATPASDEIGDQRFYYTGDGKPKVSTYDLATSGSGYPADYYELGLPLPDLKPTTVATPFTPISAESYTRDGSNNVTITTAADHNLKSGALVTISGFTYRTGTYTRAGTLLTVTISNHNIDTGAELLLEMTSGTGTSNKYAVTKTGANTFTCIDSATGTTSGNIRWSIRDLNNTQEITVIDPKTITYFSTGPKIAKTMVTTAATYSQTTTTVTVTSAAHGLANGEEVLLDFTSGTATDGTYIVASVATDTFTVTAPTATTSGNVNWSKTAVGKLDLGGQIQARTHLYTWYTPWDEESIGSEPSEALFIKEGQIVTVSNLPSAPPSGKNFVRAIRLYRTLSGNTDADYFRLATLYYPNTISGVMRTNGVSRVTMLYPHNLIKDDRFKIDGCTLPSFDITDGVVTDIINEYTFEYAQAAVDYYTAVASGTLYYDSAENPDKDPARYWGLGGDYTFVDNFSYRSLLDVLTSNEYDPPPEDLIGLTVLQNGMMVGFTGNDLYFCEPKIFHAWPQKYKRSFESPIVGLATIGGNLLVLTESYPYVISGTDPAIMSQARLSSRYPCLNRQSIVETSFGVVYTTHDGLVVYAPAQAAQLMTKAIHSSDTWNASLDPTTLVGTTYKDLYFASHSAGAITFETSTDQKIGPTFVDNDFIFTASWYDDITNDLYIISGDEGDIYKWDDPSQPLGTMYWKSKVMVSKDYTNLGAARVVADYTGEDQSTIWNQTEANWEADDQLWDQLDNITFRLYVDKNLIFTTTVSNSNAFRLPTGYRSDTFEVEIESVVRVRSIHLGETPTSLRTS